MLMGENYVFNKGRRNSVALNLYVNNFSAMVLPLSWSHGNDFNTNVWQWKASIRKLLETPSLGLGFSCALCYICLKPAAATERHACLDK